MSKFNMIATSPLDGYSKVFDGVSLSEITNLAVVSIATPLGGAFAMEKAIRDGFKTDLPNVGSYMVTPFGNGLLLGLQPGQLLAMFENIEPNPEKIVAAQLGGNGYLTDQSDSYAILSITGKNTRPALERICPIDLHPNAFPVGRVVRTIMEHIGTIILRNEPDSFLLMSPRSSAKAFLHAIETSIHNVT